MLQLDAAELRRRLPTAALVAALRAMFIRGCEVPLRHTHAIGEAGTTLLMPAWPKAESAGLAGRHFGVKTINIFPGNTALGLPGLHAVYLLFDARTGVPVALMDGAELTAHRTAAASALAASFLARPDAQHLLVVGAGRVAALLPVAMRSVCPGLDRVTVWNHRSAGAVALAARLRGEGFDAVASTDLEAAVRSACIVSCATLASLADAPLVRGAWLQPGTHLDLIGSFSPSMREADADCLARCRVFVDTDEALSKSGDVLQAVAEGRFSVGRLQATLEQLCRGERSGRTHADELTLFKSVGTALEDLAAAELALDPASSPGAGAPDNRAHPS